MDGEPEVITWEHKKLKLNEKRGCPRIDHETVLFMSKP